MEVRQQHVQLPAQRFTGGGEFARRVLRGRLRGSAVAHACGIAVLMGASSLGLLPGLLVASLVLALVVADGLLWMQVARMRTLPRHDLSMSGPLSAIASIPVIGLALFGGEHRAAILAATVPFLSLATCHLKRVNACRMGATLLAFAGLGAMVKCSLGDDMHRVACLLLALTAVCVVGMLGGVGGFTRALKLASIDTWIRSDDPQQRLFMLRYLVGAFNCALGVTVLNIGLRYGICREPQMVHGLTWLAVAVMGMFFTILRSGLNRRFADPSMTEYQIVAAISFLALGYWLASTRGEGVAMVILIIILMFGMFSTTPAKIGRCSVYGLFTFGCAMVAVGMTDAEPGTVVLQCIHFAVLVVALPTTYILASQLAELRSRLRQRREALTEALDRIEVLATRDELTGLPNRRDMLAQLAVQQQRARRSGKPFCLCMVDIDHFKRINDVHGHSVGDGVLTSFAGTARASLRDTDLIARWGGEEFLVMLPDTERDVAQSAIDRMHKAIASSSTSGGKPKVPVTFSAGLVSCEPNEPIGAAIERADLALYRAKSEGRDRTVLN
jgi:diguanylate cyclase (GGDEF)-like protein